jgi:hypothetical protein
VQALRENDSEKVAQAQRKQEAAERLSQKLTTESAK